jgi:very-short-patch-repair endonuclease
MTSAERILWEQLRRNQLDGLHFRRQQVIDGFIVDFYCHRKNLVIEVDGGIHQQQHSYDAEREQALSQCGLRVLRFTNDEVTKDLRSVLQCIAAACT